jgi:hypothetical protein
MRLHNAGSEGTASKEHEELDLQQKRVQQGQRVLPDRQSVSEFDALLKDQQQARAEVTDRREAAEPADDAPRTRRAFKNGLGLDSLPTEPPASLLAMLQPPGNVQIQAQITQTASTSAQRASEVVDLLRKHVKQLAISPKLASSDAQQAWLKLSDDLLPGTELLIEHDNGRWQVQARSDSRASIDLMEQCADQLQARFDDAGLGSIALRVEFLG